MSEILRVEKIRKVFGGLVALKNVDLALYPNEILGLIGPNGAGKTTMFNIIAGVLRPDSGTVRFRGADITKRRPDQRCLLGIARTFQIAKPFQNMNLLENVTVGAYFGEKKKSMSSAKKLAEDVLDFVGMGDLSHEEAKNLSIGNRQKLELARALATKPQVL